MVARKRSGRKAQQPQQPSPEAAAAEAAAAAPAVVHGLQPSLEEVLAAVGSLHADQLRPSGRILRKRLSERASGLAMEEIYSAVPGASPASLPEIDVAHLRALCTSCSQLRMEMADEGSDWSVVLLDRAADFVDVHSVEDSYPMELWTAAESYFLSLEGPEMKLPGGRYACAQALLGRRLDFLEGRSLGQVCHIVQLAISERKILGYCNGTVVPYGHSQSMLKERCAEQQQPIASPSERNSDTAQPMPLATWEIARRLLREILEEALQPGQGPPVVPLSNIKRLFRSKYHTELSETMLGHSRMADLMQDERFQDLCTLRLQKGGYVVVGSDISPSGKVISLASGLQLGSGELGAAGSASLAGIATPPPPSQTKQSLQLASGLQLGLGGPCKAVAEPGLAQPLRLELCLDRPMRWGDIEDTPPLESNRPSAAAVPAALPVATPLPSPGVAEDEAVARWLREPKRLSFCTNEPLCFEDASPDSTGAGAARQSLPTPLPSPGEPASATVRRWAAAPRRAEFFPSLPLAAAAVVGEPAEVGSGSSRLPLAASEETSSASSADPSPLGRERTPKPAAGSEDESLVLEDLSSSQLAMPTPLASPGDPGSATRRRWAAIPGGASRRLEFFPEPELPRQQPESAYLLGRTSPVSKSSGSLKVLTGMEVSAGVCDNKRLLEALPSPQRRTQALRASTAGRGWMPLVRELCEGADQGCPSSFVRNTFIHAKLPPTTPVAAAARSQSLPRDLGGRRAGSSTPSSRTHSVRSEVTRSPTPRRIVPLELELPIQGRAERAQPRGRFFMDGPAGQEDAGEPLEACEPREDSSAEALDMPRWLAPSPRDSGLTLVVRNTFLHSAMPPPTPAASMVRRSHSLPPPEGAQRGRGSAAVFWRSSKADEGQTSPAAAMPRFLPVSPARAATPPAESDGELVPAPASQRVVRLADLV